MSHAFYRTRRPHPRVPVRYVPQSRSALEADLALDERCVATLTERLSRPYARWQARSNDERALRDAQARVDSGRRALAQVAA